MTAYSFLQRALVVMLDHLDPLDRLDQADNLDGLESLDHPDQQVRNGFY